jgi:Arc/MetJ-type ribon-helix-helix transcriptional regulator
MENITEKISIRLKPDQIDHLDQIMVQKDIKSRSQIIRTAIESFISENLEELASKKLVIRLPNGTINKLLDCMNVGDILNFNSAIQIALDRYLTSIEEDYLVKNKQLSEARFNRQKELANKLAGNEDLR